MLMHLAMVCSDDPVSSADEVILDGVGAYATLHRQSLGAYYTTLCSLIDVTELPDATLITFPGTTHVQIGGINLCAAAVMTNRPGPNSAVGHELRGRDSCAGVRPARRQHEPRSRVEAVTVFGHNIAINMTFIEAH